MAATTFNGTTTELLSVGFERVEQSNSGERKHSPDRLARSQRCVGSRRSAERGEERRIRVETLFCRNPAPRNTYSSHGPVSRHALVHQSLAFAVPGGGCHGRTRTPASAPRHARPLRGQPTHSEPRSRLYRAMYSALTSNCPLVPRPGPASRSSSPSPPRWVSPRASSPAWLPPSHSGALPALAPS